MSDYLTVREVAAMYRVNEITVRRHIRSGKLRAAKVGGRVRVRKEDASDLIQPLPVDAKARRTVPPPTPEELARRRMVIARIEALRTTMAPLDVSTADLLRLARQEAEDSDHA